MKTRLHGILGGAALICLVTFWLSTIISEIIGSHAGIATVKTMILQGMLLLIPLLIVTGASGHSLSKSRGGRLVNQKSVRMKIAAANGLLILLPSAIMLAAWANAGRFDWAFYALQTVELTAGAVNISLLALNMRDGLRLTGRLRSSG